MKRESPLKAYFRQMRDVSRRISGHLSQTLKDLPSQLQFAVLRMAKQGWFYDFDIPIQDLWEIEEGLENNALSASADKRLCDYFEGRASSILISLSNKYPRRAHILTAAFDAHWRDQYILSIPVLLAQTDGISKDALGGHFFRRESDKKQPGKRRPAAAAYADNIEDPITKSLLAILTEIHPINASENEREKGAEAFNRHLILHGISVEYGTKTNSLKTISLINYIGHIT